MCFLFMHSQGGRLYVTRITGQQEYRLLNELWGLNPSEERASLRFLGWLPNSGYFVSTNFQVGESVDASSFHLFSYHWHAKSNP
ncbi:hypothetical protein RchiOBHm_Chr5g0021131 [Rosa chinensis]|uniref:Uncharacterized protein n=1 Tax=Rosa chinensis TaxID=74649 RepID=A0A2P6Q7G8_ROSCH|nr:hypothetical protein RchiOBHm_Chr5g0021131 [Rosa chinensis]